MRLSYSVLLDDILDEQIRLCNRAENDGQRCIAPNGRKAQQSLLMPASSIKKI
jgi:hypothetical protein